MQTKYSLIFISLIIVLTLSCQQKLNKNELDKYLTHCFDNGIFNGTICVMYKNQIMYKEAFGYANFATKERLTTSHAFYLASVSKQFTTAAIMILVENGLLNYDDSLIKFFPQFPDYAKNVNLANLMTHTSGIGDHFELGAYKQDLNNKDVLELLIDQDSLNFEPGTRYQYSNGAYVLLALIVEKVSGKPFHVFMKQNIFLPLHMNNTLVYDESKPEIINRAIGHNSAGEVDDYNILTTGAGGMYSTVEDLAKWNVALYNKKILRSETLDEAYKKFRLNDNNLINYGYGWEVYEDDSGKRVAHSGNLSGFRTYIERNLENNISFFYLTNHGNSIPIDIVNEGIRNILNNKPYTLPNY